MHNKILSLFFAAVFAAFAFMLISAFPSASAQGSSPLNVSKTWSCSSGFSCSSETLGICGSTFQPYLPMNYNQYTFNFNAPKVAAYKCTITAVANHFDYPAGGPQETNEVTEIALNDKAVGRTLDTACPPGGVCENPCLPQCAGICSGCPCVCPMCTTNMGGDPNVLRGGNQHAFSGKICFKVKQALLDLDEGKDKAQVLGVGGSTNRNYIQIRYRNWEGERNIEPRAGYCMDCGVPQGCYDWCTLLSNIKEIPAIVDHTYKVEVSSDRKTVTFSDQTSGSTITLSTPADRLAYYSGLNLGKYCGPGDGCSWLHGAYFFAPAGTVEVFDCGGDGDGDGECKEIGERCSISLGDCCADLRCLKAGGYNYCTDCGDGTCDTEYGENQWTCPEDCA